MVGMNDPGGNPDRLPIKVKLLSVRYDHPLSISGGGDAMYLDNPQLQVSSLSIVKWKIL
jgi:hypothetical protein